MTMISQVGFAKQVTEAYRTSEPSAVGAPDFASMIGQAAQNAIHTVREAEQVTAAGVAGKADTQAVVQALTNAELTMQTVVAVRDKIRSAYNDVIHMNI